MQNVSNTGKDSQAKPEELNMTKLVDNGKILILDNESMSKKPLSIEESIHYCWVCTANKIRQKR